MSIFKDQEDFMRLGGQKTDDALDDAQLQLYVRLVREESGELQEAFPDGTASPLAEAVKEATDVVVVAAGFLITALGADRAQEAWNLVYESNLAKVQGGVEKRDDGKILKNDEYKKVAKAKLMAALEELVCR